MTNKLQQVATITIPYKDIEPQINKELVKAGQTAKLDGFRKGKVPQEVLKEKYGGAVMHRVAEENVKKYFMEKMLKDKVKLAGIISYEAKKLELGQDFVYDAIYEVYPDVKAKVPSNLNLDQITAEVDEKDVDRTIEDMRRRVSKFEDTIIGITAAKEHFAVVSYEAETTDENKQKFSAKETFVALADTYPSADFVAALIGMKAGEQKFFTAKVPLRAQPNPQDQANAGGIEEKEVNFKLTLDKLQRQVLPDLNEEFFRKFGVAGGEKEFRTQIKNNMEFELSNALKRIKFKTVANAVASINQDMPLPETQIEREAIRMRDSALQMLAQQMGGTEKLPKAEDVPLTTFKEKAAEKVRTGLFLGALAEKKSILPTDQEVQQSINDLAEIYENPDELKKKYTEDQRLHRQIYNKVLEEKALEEFLTQAKATPKKIGYQEALAMSAALSSGANESAPAS